MTPSSYQPFLIGSGQTKTGLFQYLESWVKPEDAFDDIQDAYVNRGQIWKRDGQTLLGKLKYCTSQVLGYGDDTFGPFSGSFSTDIPRAGHLPIVPGSVTVTARETILGFPENEVFTDTGVGGLNGNHGGNGSIDYTTGAWSITGGFPVNNGSPIMIEYTYEAATASNAHEHVSIVQNVGSVNSAGPFSGTYSQDLPIDPGSAFITFCLDGTGATTYLDDGSGSFRVSLPLGTVVGTINYTTGAWSFTVNGPGQATAYSPIQLGFTPVNTSQFTIMGITQWNDEANNTFDLVVEDTRRASVYNLATESFDPICDVAETLFILPNNSTDSSPVHNFDNGTDGVTPTFPLIAPLSITITLVDNVSGEPIDSQTDDGAGGLTASLAGYLDTGSIDYYTGRFKVNVAFLYEAGWAINATFKLQNDYFFGDTSNFFNWTNWEPSTNLIVTSIANPPPPAVPEDPTQFQRGFLYLTNNYDPITLYRDGILSRPSFALRQSVLGLGKNEIVRCLDIKTFASRLLIVRPTTTISDGNPDPQSIRWSAQFQPTNTVADIPGSGGELSAATSDWIQSTKFLKDFIVVNMQNSVWYFRFTGSAFAPFVYYKANSTKSTNAPYGSIEFDDQVTAMGKKGLIYCDGTTIDRYDLKIFDQYESINNEVFFQCFGQRFDALNQSWMLYPAMENNSLLSNKVLLYNYVEDSWSTFNMPLSCLGLGFGITDVTWADFAPGGKFGASGLTWEEADFAWNSYLLQKESLRLLGGDFNGNVLQLNDGPTDNGSEIRMNLTTKKYNPFAKDGAKGQFGYIDIYYTVSPDVQLTFNFFINNNRGNIAFTRQIQLTGTPDAEYGWQRIFLNVQAEQIQWQITDNGSSGFRILGQILWARPAGRLTS